MSVFRIVDRDGEMLANADSLNGVTEVVRNAPSGRYQVDEKPHEPLPCFRSPSKSDVISSNGTATV